MYFLVRVSLDTFFEGVSRRIVKECILFPVVVFDERIGHVIFTKTTYMDGFYN